MPDIPQAPLALTAMTLRGVGSYLHGQRLDIRPLTILCGANGSGKSTWLNALNLLRESLEKGDLPWSLARGVSEGFNIEVLNARVYLDHERKSPLFSDASALEQFGPPGTIGIEFTATSNFQLPVKNEGGAIEVSLPVDFFANGRISAGTTFRFQIASPGDVDEVNGDLLRAATLALRPPNSTGWHTIGLRWTRREAELRTNLQTGVTERMQHGDDIVDVRCSSAFLAYDPNRGKAIQELLGQVRLMRSGREYQGVRSETPEWNRFIQPSECEHIVRRFEQRVHDLLQVLFDAYFFIGAIRNTRQPEFGEELPRELVLKRRVGPHELAAWACEEEFKFNRMNEPSPPLEARTIEHCVTGYVSFWCDRLLGKKLAVRGVEMFPNTSKVGPSGYLIEKTAEPNPGHRQTYDYDRLTLLEDSCFGKGRDNAPQAAARMSAGFHQIFPMVMQTALMQKDELLAIENPEVHLHPSLQIKLTEFLIQQATAGHTLTASGKRLLIETHSDLVVRRVLRAMLAEEIGQSQVAIYFADIEKEEHGYHYSTLSELTINDKGQIANWPAGFMDDDVKESRRLLDIMYGESNKEDDNE